ncbi:CDP-glycerol glycerophosphotransferase family protein [Pseudomonas guariconensis]|uniref:CDP-glycerol glycerophosphotransferase family protein n=1 Tax=Pseudomonas guariconensis TaxID=1288410 RepID=UPI00209B582D|nr:CDP-glycerol glycerophosphotransferase family protein [Pseudomonas guariconensis]MCO7630552.1 CDP-glycerol glycerophosphotransferase family protein [Pseudomonas guariconensis]
MKVAFIVWNPFQLIQFEPLAKLCVEPTVILIDKETNAKLFPRDMLKSKHWKTVFVKPAEIPLIDGTHDVIVFQSAFPNIEKIKESKLVSLQYGLAKERHNYGEWRALADMNLMYGEYSKNIVSHYAPSYSVGNLKFDNWQDYLNRYSESTELKKELNLDPTKKTLLYMPTWGELGSFDALLKPIASLQSKYNVILKMHHNNDAKVPEWLISARQEKLKHIHDGSADQLKLLCAADLIISDFSGAIFDGMFANKPILLFQENSSDKIGVQKFDLESLEFARRNEIGHVCESADDFEGSVHYALTHSVDLVEKAKHLRSELFSQPSDKSSAQASIDYITKLANGEIPSLTQAQKYVRETVQKLRTIEPKYNRLQKQVKTMKKPFLSRLVSLKI